MNTTSSNTSLDTLQAQAAEERNHLHETVSELRAKVEAGREKLSLSHQAREHFWGASLLVSVLSLGLGYRVAGIFTRR